MNVIAVRSALKNLPEILDLLRQAQSSVRSLRLDEHVAGLLDHLPKRTVKTLSLPLAFASFGAGVVTGAAATALLTPKRGDELRAALRSEIERVWSNMVSEAEAETGEKASSKSEGNGDRDDDDRGEAEAENNGAARGRNKHREIATS